MKNIIIVIITLFTLNITAQELSYKEIKTKIFTAIESNFPVRFNSTESLRNVFYGKCNEYPKHCTKLKFGKLTDFRILGSSPYSTDSKEVGNPNNEPENYFTAFFDFSYNAEPHNHYGTVIIECKIIQVLDAFEIDYIKIIGTKGMHEYITRLEEEEFYILNRLFHKDQ
jgi:hypothetical protein